jgi:hypothetical protein
VSKVDERAIQDVKDQLSAAVGEAMLVRIEIDRLSGITDEKLDKATLRMAEIEALLADEMDVSSAVQLERLEELERALAELNPDQFVRRTDPGVRAGSTGSAGTPSTSLNPGLSTDSATNSSEPSFSSH